MTQRLEKLPQAELAGHAPEQLPGPEIDRLGRRSGLTARVAVNVRNAIARIRPGIARNGIFVEDADDLGHGSSPLAYACGETIVRRHHGRHVADYTPEPGLRRIQWTDDRPVAIAGLVCLAAEHGGSPLRLR